ncbi:MAG: hypothetical protein AABW79_02865 [Nanoarchaeota archaeon]
MRNKSGLIDKVYGFVREEAAEVIAEGDEKEAKEILNIGIAKHARKDAKRYFEIFAGRTITCVIACVLSGLTGEAIDHTPYLKDAIPYFFESAHVTGTQGNLDKIACGLTFGAYMIAYGAQRVKSKRSNGQ